MTYLFQRPSIVQPSAGWDMDGKFLKKELADHTVMTRSVMMMDQTNFCRQIADQTGDVQNRLKFCLSTL
jgi:hypothetical protein